VIVAFLVAVFSLANAVPLEKLAENCGKPAIKPDTSTNILGGKDAVPHSWPWQVQIELNGKPWCAGTLIEDQWVLTAAQCIKAVDPGKPDQWKYKVRLGAHDRSNKNEAGVKVVDVSEVKAHPQYNAKQGKNDVALLKLKTKVVFTDNISPVCLPATQGEDLPADETNTFVVGWGRTSGTAPDQSNTLKQTFLPLVAQDECSNPDRNKYVDDTLFCAGGGDQGRSACGGDNGGPALIEPAADGAGAWKQVGIFSYVEKANCAQPGFTVFTRVSSFVTWINQQIA